MIMDQVLQIMFYAVMTIGGVSIIAGLWAVWRDVRDP